MIHDTLFLFFPITQLKNNTPHLFQALSAARNQRGALYILVSSKQKKTKTIECPFSFVLSHTWWIKVWRAEQK